MTTELLNTISRAYSVLDDRRRKAFNVLLSATAIFVLIGFSNSDGIKIPLLGVELDKFLTVALAPLFIGILFGRYFYLCSHTLRLYIKYIELFEKVYEKDIRELGWDFTDLHNSIRMRDLTEVLNPFLFPRRFGRTLQFSINCILYYFAVCAHNTVILLTIFAPAIAYSISVFWLNSNYSGHMNEIVGMALIWAYVIAAIGMIPITAYLFLGSSSARSTYFEKRYTEKRKT